MTRITIENDETIAEFYDVPNEVAEAVKTILQQLDITSAESRGK